MFWANVIITALFDSEHRLRGFAKVTRDMTERRRIEALEHGERKMNEFLAMLGHELRNPLAPIRNALDLMRIDSTGDSKHEWARSVIDRQLTQLTRLVDDLLDVGRITSGKIALHRSQFTIHGMPNRSTSIPTRCMQPPGEGALARSSRAAVECRAFPGTSHAQ